MSDNNFRLPLKTINLEKGWISLFLLVSSLYPVHAQEIYYVSKEGNDQWSGTLPESNMTKTDGPFATVQKAKAIVRQSERFEPITVFIRQGIYYLNEKLIFRPEDSGTPNTPITYKSYDGENAVISGGRPISNWQESGHLWVAEIDDVNSGNLYFNEFFINDERRIRARNPNNGDFFRINGGVTGDDRRSFRFHSGDIELYDNLQDVQICLYQSWEGIQLWIDDIDPGQNIVTFSPDVWFAVGHFDNRARYYVENAYELLDEPGEWYLNRTTGRLYYYPLTGENKENIQAVIPVMDHVIELIGNVTLNNTVQYLHFEGLGIKHADWFVRRKEKVLGQAHVQLNDAVVYLLGAKHCSITNCDIALGGAHGVILTKGCQENTLRKCHIHALGGGGVYIGDTSDFNACQNPNQNEMIHANTVDNCFIHDLTHVHHGSVGIWIGCASNNIITNNHICDIDYTGISVGWCWGYQSATQANNLIAHNHIHHLGRGELSDMGGIYTLGVSPGTVIRQNLIHDIYAFSYGGWGIYTDEGSSGIVIEQNIVYNTKSSGFHQHYGQTNTVRNNILAFEGEAGYMRNTNENRHSFIFEKNIVLTCNGVMNGGAWSDDQFTCDNNLYWDMNSGHLLHFDKGPIGDWQVRGHDLHSRVEDPLFVNAHDFHFQLLPNSPAHALGFQNIDISNIGLYGDFEWTNLPERVEHQAVYQGAGSPITPFFNKDEIFDDFENTPVGAYPKYAIIWGNTGNTSQSIYVSDIRAATGIHSLRIDDRTLSERTYEPYLTYNPLWYFDGEVEVEFDIFMESGTSITHEWRDNKSYPENRGVSIDLKPGSTWQESSTSVVIPTDEWFHLKIVCKLGGEANGRYDAAVLVGDKTVSQNGLELINTGWHKFYKAYFVSTTNMTASVYLDNIHFKYDRHGTGVEEINPSDVPMTYALEQNYPNPFNPHTNITYKLPKRSHVVLQILDARGRQLDTLVNETQNGGQYHVPFSRGTLPSGLYICHLQAGEYISVRKMLLIR